MQLTYQQQLRSESDPVVIANLQRKGWVETVPPSYAAATQHAPEWANGAWVVRDKTAEEIVAAARKIWPSAADLWNEFTRTEKLAIADSTNPDIRLLHEDLRVRRGEVWSDADEVQKGLGLLVAVGILTESRKTEILNK
jgi:hypothetical protein